MALVAAALAGDSDGAATLLLQHEADDLRHIVVRLAGMAADALLSQGELAGASPEEVAEHWRACILDLERQHGEGDS